MQKLMPEHRRQVTSTDRQAANCRAVLPLLYGVSAPCLRFVGLKTAPHQRHRAKHGMFEEPEVKTPLSPVPPAYGAGQTRPPAYAAPQMVPPLPIASPPPAEQIDKFLSAVPEQAPAATLLVTRHEEHHRIPQWLLRMELFLRVLLRMYIGLAIFIAPWWKPFWDQNPLFTQYPTLAIYAANGAVRGFVSGLGLLNLWIAFRDAVRHRND